MIDLLIPILALAGGLLWAFRRARARVFLAVMLAAAGLAHVASVVSLYRAGLGYEYVTLPSPASQAGLRGAGTLVEVNGEPVGSLGALLERAFFAEQVSFRVTGGSTGHTQFRRQEPSGDGWLFWRAVDSYALEHAAGGLALLPRRAIYHVGRAFGLDHQLSTPQRNLVRLVSVAGKDTPTIGAFLAALAPLPEKGVVPVQYMRPSTDNGLATVFFSWLALPARAEYARMSRPDQLQPALGLSGYPVVRKFLPGPFDPYFAPGSLKRPGFAFPLGSTGTQYFSTIVRPRIALFSWVGPHPLATVVLGYAGIFVRQLLSLAELPLLALFWPELPKQYYALDDSIGATTLFFRLGSLAASLAISTAVVGLALRRRSVPGWLARRRPLLAFLVVLLLQFADVFVIRPY